MSFQSVEDRSLTKVSYSAYGDILRTMEPKISDLKLQDEELNSSLYSIVAVGGGILENFILTYKPDCPENLTISEDGLIMFMNEAKDQVPLPTEHSEAVTGTDIETSAIPKTGTPQESAFTTACSSKLEPHQLDESIVFSTRFEHPQEVVSDQLSHVTKQMPTDEKSKSAANLESLFGKAKLERDARVLKSTDPAILSIKTLPKQRDGTNTQGHSRQSSDSSKAMTSLDNDERQDFWGQPPNSPATTVSLPSEPGTPTRRAGSAVALGIAKPSDDSMIASLNGGLGGSMWAPKGQTSLGSTMQHSTLKSTDTPKTFRFPLGKSMNGGLGESMFAAKDKVSPTNSERNNSLMPAYSSKIVMMPLNESLNGGLAASMHATKGKTLLGTSVQDITSAPTHAVKTIGSASQESMNGGLMASMHAPKDKISPRNSVQNKLPVSAYSSKSGRASSDTSLTRGLGDSKHASKGETSLKNSVLDSASVPSLTSKTFGSTSEESMNGGLMASMHALRDETSLGKPNSVQNSSSKSVPAPKISGRPTDASLNGGLKASMHASKDRKSPESSIQNSSLISTKASRTFESSLDKSLNGGLAASRHAAQPNRPKMQDKSQHLKEEGNGTMKSTNDSTDHISAGNAAVVQSDVRTPAAKVGRKNRSRTDKQKRESKERRVLEAQTQQTQLSLDATDALDKGLLNTESSKDMTTSNSKHEPDAHLTDTNKTQAALPSDDATLPIQSACAVEDSCFGNSVADNHIEATPVEPLGHPAVQGKLRKLKKVQAPKQISSKAKADAKGAKEQECHAEDPSTSTSEPQGRYRMSGESLALLSSVEDIYHFTPTPPVQRTLSEDLGVKQPQISPKPHPTQRLKFSLGVPEPEPPKHSTAVQSFGKNALQSLQQATTQWSVNTKFTSGKPIKTTARRPIFSPNLKSEPTGNTLTFEGFTRENMQKKLQHVTSQWTVSTEFQSAQPLAPGATSAVIVYQDPIRLILKSIGRYWERQIFVAIEVPSSISKQSIAIITPLAPKALIIYPASVMRLSADRSINATQLLLLHNEVEGLRLRKALNRHQERQFFVAIEVPSYIPKQDIAITAPSLLYTALIIHPTNAIKLSAEQSIDAGQLLILNNEVEALTLKKPGMTRDPLSGALVYDLGVTTYCSKTRMPDLASSELMTGPSPRTSTLPAPQSRDSSFTTNSPPTHTPISEPSIYNYITPDARCSKLRWMTIFPKSGPICQYDSYEGDEVLQSYLSQPREGPAEAPPETKEKKPSRRQKARKWAGKAVKSLGRLFCIGSKSQPGPLA